MQKLVRTKLWRDLSEINLFLHRGIVVIEGEAQFIVVFNEMRSELVDLFPKSPSDLRVFHRLWDPDADTSHRNDGLVALGGSSILVPDHYVYEIGLCHVHEN